MDVTPHQEEQGIEIPAGFSAESINKLAILRDFSDYRKESYGVNRL